jgi:YXWGXW repeat-containing protein
MWKPKLLWAALATASIGVMPLPASADIGLFIDIAPPAPRYEVVPAPRAGFVWMPGYWDWRGNRHVWTRGHWERERHGYYWHPNRWEQREGRWVLERGRWDRERFVENRRFEERRAYGDRDRDGVPNRYDRDRDGDGVPNRYDRAPGNPNRQ